MAEDVSLGEGIGLGTSLPPPKWGIAQGVNTGLQMKLRSDMVEAQQDKYSRQLQKSIQDNVRKSSAAKFNTPWIATEWADKASKAFDLKNIQDQESGMAYVQELELDKTVKGALDKSWSDVHKLVTRPDVFVPKEERAKYDEARTSREKLSLLDGSRYFQLDPETGNIAFEGYKKVDLSPAKIVKDAFSSAGVQISPLTGGWSKVEGKLNKEQINVLASSSVPNVYVADQIAEQYPKEFEAAYNDALKFNPSSPDDARVDAGRIVMASKLDEFAVQQKIRPNPRPIPNSSLNIDSDGGVSLGDKRTPFNVIEVPIAEGSSVLSKAIALPDKVITVDNQKYNIDLLYHIPSTNKWVVRGQTKHRTFNRMVPVVVDVDDNVLGQIVGKDISVKDLKKLMEHTSGSPIKGNDPNLVRKVRDGNNATPKPKGKVISVSQYRAMGPQERKDFLASGGSYK